MMTKDSSHYSSSQLDDLMRKVEKLESHFELPAFRYGDKVFMTGEEWLERFEKEIEKTPYGKVEDDGTPLFWYTDLHEAAKRASKVE